jgi:pterin-4a-carbinolamine dehydratase
MIFQLVKGEPSSKTKNLSKWRMEKHHHCIKRYWWGSFDDSIQLANMMATVANEGYYYTPHIIKR